MNKITKMQKYYIITSFIITGNHNPVNIGSDEQVSINQMIEIIEKISGIEKLDREYQLDKPKGVRGRSSDNTFIKQKLKWSPSISLKAGLEKTYKWIFDDISKKSIK